MAKVLTKLAVKRFGTRVTPERFAAIRVVDRRRSANVVGAALFAMQGKPNGRSERGILLVHDVPELRTPNAIVRSRPHLDLLRFTLIRSIGDNAMFPGECTRGHVCLHRAGHGGKAGDEFATITVGDQRLESRHGIEVLFAETGDREQNNVFGHKIGEKPSSNVERSNDPWNHGCKSHAWSLDLGQLGC